MAQGIIQVSPELWEQGLGRPFSFEAWHKALLLPENFQVVDARCNPILQGNNDHYVTVESDVIPQLTSGALPTLNAYYDKEHNTPFLDRIELYPSKARIWSRFDTVLPAHWSK